MRTVVEERSGEFPGDYFRLHHRVVMRFPKAEPIHNHDDVWRLDVPIGRLGAHVVADLVLDPPVPGDHASTRVNLRVYSKKGLFGGGLAAKAADQIWEALGDTSL